MCLIEDERGQRVRFFCHDFCHEVLMLSLPVCALMPGKVTFFDSILKLYVRSGLNCHLFCKNDLFLPAVPVLNGIYSKFQIFAHRQEVFTSSRHQPTQHEWQVPTSVNDRRLKDSTKLQ